MKVSAKSVLIACATFTIIGLQAFVINQQNQANKALESKVSKLQSQINDTSTRNASLISKIEEIENSLQTKPRQLLSMR